MKYTSKLLLTAFFLLVNGSSEYSHSKPIKLEGGNALAVSSHLELLVHLSQNRNPDSKNLASGLLDVIRVLSGAENEIQKSLNLHWLSIERLDGSASIRVIVERGRIMTDSSAKEQVSGYGFYKAVAKTSSGPERKAILIRDMATLKSEGYAINAVYIIDNGVQAPGK